MIAWHCAWLLNTSMARFKDYDYAQDLLVSVNLSEQLLPGTLEYAINHLIDNRIGLERFEGRYNNDETGQKAYDPRLLLKIVLYAYSQGILSSRKMEQACRTNIIFMALGCGMRPDHSTFAAFVSELGEEAEKVFQEVLLACDEAGLLGYSHFALDGVKLPSNASREWSGKHGDLARKRDKIRIKIKEKVAEHKRADRGSESEDTRHAEQIERLERHAAKIDAFLEESDPKIGESGKEIIDNVTDPESCSMKTRHGMVQGYNAQALVDEEWQVVVHAGVEATGHDQRLAEHALDEAKRNLSKSKLEGGALAGAYLSADCQYHSEENLAAAEKHGMEAYIPDNRFRQRDPAFDGRERHKPKPKGKKRFVVEDFEYDEKSDRYVCPNGKLLKLNARKMKKRNNLYRRYSSHKRDCAGCPLRERCLLNGNRKTRTLLFPVGKVEETLKEKMMRKIDLPESKRIYGKRMHIVEPVFGNIRHNKGMSRFMLRGKAKVNAQWLLYCAVHNIEKWAKNASFPPFAGRIGSIASALGLRRHRFPPRSTTESQLPQAA